MGIYDREYYREKTRGSGWFSGTAPACKAIILINAAVFILPKFFPGLDQILTDWFVARSTDIFQKGRVWELVTASFIHEDWNLFGVFVNMLFVWMIGREMEAFYGTREFWWLYLSAAVISTFCWAAVDFAKPVQHSYMLGASGAVLTVVSLYTFYNPHREVILIIFPVEMWVLLAIFVVTDFLQVMSRSHDPIAYASHLGGFAYAVAFKAFDLRLIRLKSMLPTRPRLRIVSPPDQPRESSHPRPSSTGPSWSSDPASASARPSSTAVVTEEQLDAKLDELLVKIAREGRASLTDEEKRILEEASRRARNKRGERI
jgi:membrane associated rhomboid family serine protease